MEGKDEDPVEGFGPGGLEIINRAPGGPAVRARAALLRGRRCLIMGPVPENTWLNSCVRPVACCTPARGLLTRTRGTQCNHTECFLLQRVFLPVSPVSSTSCLQPETWESSNDSSCSFPSASSSRSSSGPYKSLEVQGEQDLYLFIII